MAFPRVISTAGSLAGGKPTIVLLCGKLHGPALYAVTSGYVKF
jgi:hypothetical protein